MYIPQTKIVCHGASNMCVISDNGNFETHNIVNK